MEAREVVVPALGVEKNRIGAVVARELVFLQAKAVATRRPVVTVVVVVDEGAAEVLADELASLHHEVHVHDQLPLGYEALPHHEEGDAEEAP